MVVVSIIISLIFDTTSTFGQRFGFNAVMFQHFFAITSIVVWTMAYSALFKEGGSGRKISLISSFVCGGILLFLMFSSNLNEGLTKGSFVAVSDLHKIILAIIFFTYVILYHETKDFAKSSFFWYSTINLIRYSISIVSFSLFDILVNQIDLLYLSMYFHWVLIVLSNFAFAYVFWALARKNWQTSIY